MDGSPVALAHLLPQPTAFVLGGGGSYGAVQMGMIRALAETDLRPSLVVGTSVGALNGVLVAANPETGPTALAAVWPQIERKQVFPGNVVSHALAVGSSRPWLFNPGPLSDLVAAHLPVTHVEDLAVPFVAVATDLDTGVRVEIDSGDLRSALLASSAIPGVFPWVERDGRRLVDGGLVANVPVGGGLARGAKSVVVLDCGRFGTDGRWAQGLIAVMCRPSPSPRASRSSRDLAVAGTSRGLPAHAHRDPVVPVRLPPHRAARRGRLRRVQPAPGRAGAAHASSCPRPVRRCRLWPSGSGRLRAPPLVTAWVAYTVAPSGHYARNGASDATRGHPMTVHTASSAGSSTTSTVGDVYQHPFGRTISEADSTWFTQLTCNTNQNHFNAHLAQSNPITGGRIIVNSGLTVALVLGLSVIDMSQNAVANLGWTDIKLTHPVYIGDTIYAESICTDKRESSSRPDDGHHHDDHPRPQPGRRRDRVVDPLGHGAQAGERHRPGLLPAGHGRAAHVPHPRLTPPRSSRVSVDPGTGGSARPYPGAIARRVEVRMGSPELVTALSGIDLFRGLSTRVLTRIADSGHEAHYDAGTAVVLQGQSVEGFKAFSPTGVEMHVILDGAARVDVNGATMNRLGPGQYFGELSLIDGGPRSADVVADDGGLTTFALTKWTFEDMLDKHPEIAVPMLRVMCARLRARESAPSDTI